MDQIALAVDFLHSNQDQAFQVASNAAMVGWILLALLPGWAITRFAVKLSVITNSVLYIAFLFTSIDSSFSISDFSSWKGVLNLFRNGPEGALLAAWIHYLAFDLICGYYIAADALKNNINQFLTIPFLFLTLMFGPTGFFAWFVGRNLLGAKSSWLSFDGASSYAGSNADMSTSMSSKKKK